MENENKNQETAREAMDQSLFNLKPKAGDPIKPARKPKGPVKP
jgi:hypothetical protein